MSVRSGVAAFARRSVRRRHALELLAYSGLLALVLLLIAHWIVGVALDAPPPDPLMSSSPPPRASWDTLLLADLMGLGLMALGLFVLAPALAASVVAAERRAGTLEQLRTTPLSPLALLAGLVLGVPARLYLLCAGPFALHAAAALTGRVAPYAFAASVVVLGVGGLACALLGAFVSLMPQRDLAGPFAPLGVAAGLFFGSTTFSSMAQGEGSVRWAFLHPAGALASIVVGTEGLGRDLLTSRYGFEKFSDPAYTGPLALSPVLSVIFLSLVGAVLGRATVRRLGGPHLTPLSKPQATALFGLLAAALLLPSPENVSATMWPLFALLLLPALLVLGLLATPSADQWALRLRKGLPGGAFADASAPHLAVYLMQTIFFALAALRLKGFPWALCEAEALGFAWAVAVSATLPIYLFFVNTRYPSGNARWAFGVAVAVHLMVQAVAMAMVAHDHLGPGERLYVELALLEGVLVPAWVAWRQLVLRRRIIAGA